MDTRQLPRTSRRFDRTLSIFLLAVAGFLVLGLHLSGLVDTWRNEPTALEYLNTPTPFWLVKFMDLGIVAPALIVIANRDAAKRPVGREGKVLSNRMGRSP